MIRLTLLAAAAVSLVLLAGCKKDIQNQDAVRQGVMSYLSKRSDLLAMDVSVTSVAFRQDEATAQVHFQAKGNSSPAAGMTMQYVLEHKDGQWVVKGPHGSERGPRGERTRSEQRAWPGCPDRWTECRGSAAHGIRSLPPGHPTVNPDSSSQQK